MYIGLLTCCKERQFSHNIKRISLSSGDHKLLETLKSAISELKLSLIRTPIHDDADLSSLETLAEEKYKNILGQFADFMQNHFGFVGKILNNDESMSQSSNGINTSGSVIIFS
jgi:hypothetical protein